MFDNDGQYHIRDKLMIYKCSNAAMKDWNSYTLSKQQSFLMMQRFLSMAWKYQDLDEFWKVCIERLQWTKQKATINNKVLLKIYLFVNQWNITLQTYMDKNRCKIKKSPSEFKRHHFAAFYSCIQIFCPTHAISKSFLDKSKAR